MDRLICPFEVKVTQSDDGCITGYGSVFGNVDSHRDIVAKGAFKSSIANSKSGAAEWPLMLLQHGMGDEVESKMPVGIWTDIDEDDTGLLMQGKLALKTQRGAEAYELMDEADDGSRTEVKSPLVNILARRPNDWMTSFMLREQMTLHAVLTGNAYGYLGWGGGELQEIIPLVPGSVQVVRMTDWSLEYHVSDLAGKSTIVPPENILHIRGPSWNGYLGMEAVQLAREAIGLAITTEQTHASLHLNGAQPGGVLSVKGKLDTPARERLKAAWQAFQGGVQNRFKTAVLDVDATWTPLAMTGVDSQHLETRRFQIEEICRAMRVFPQMVMHMEKTSTFASAEAFFLSHVTHSLMPWVKRWEESFNHALFAKTPNLHTKLSTAEMLRGSSSEKASFYMQALGGARGETAYMTRNEVRKLEGLNPIDGGDKLLIPEPPVPPVAGRPGPSSPASKSEAKYSDDESRDDHGRWGVGSMIGSYAKAAVINTVLGIFGLDILPTWAVAGIVESRKSSDITKAQFEAWYDTLSDADKNRLHDDVMKALTKEERTTLAKELAGKKYSPDQARAPNGQFGSGGGGSNHLYRVGATIAIQAIAGALKGGEGGGVYGALAGAAIGTAIAAFVEFGGANFVGENIIALVGPHILPDWAHEMLTDHHENHGKSFHTILFAALSEDEKKRFCIDTMKRMSPEMLRQLGEKIVADNAAT